MREFKERVAACLEKVGKNIVHYGDSRNMLKERYNFGTCRIKNKVIMLLMSKSVDFNLMPRSLASSLPCVQTAERNFSTSGDERQTVRLLPKELERNIRNVLKLIYKRYKIRTYPRVTMITTECIYTDLHIQEKDISIYINSPGGSVTAGLAIYDTMQYIRCDVQTICIGQAASMGAFLLAGGSAGKRFALPSSRIMIHQPWGGSGGQASDILIQTKEIIRLKKLTADRFAFHTGKPIEKLLEDMERDFYMTPEDALEYGIIDSIMPRRKNGFSVK